MFLWHFPSGHPAPQLAGIRPGGARTFLHTPSFGKYSDRPASSRHDHCIVVGECVLVNSLIKELRLPIRRLR